MEIKYLSQLRDNPEAYPNDTDYKSAIESISLQEIEQLEQLYNNGTPFPKALRELLFLAGKRCYVLDYSEEDSQEEMQEYVRERLIEKNRVISRPFYVIDIYNAGDQFLFIYLDEGENPVVYEGLYFGSVDFPDWIHKLAVSSLSDLIDRRITRVKQGENPF